jgi:hypothetical protein
MDVWNDWANIIDTETGAREMLEALEGMVSLYVSLVLSGDAGYWNPETDDQVKAARAAIARAKGEQKEAKAIVGEIEGGDRRAVSNAHTGEGGITMHSVRNLAEYAPAPWSIKGRNLDGRMQFTILDGENNIVAGVDARASVLSGFGKDNDARSRRAEGQPEAWFIANAIAALPRMEDVCRELAQWYDLLHQNYPDMCGLVQAAKEAKAIVGEIEGGES